MVIVRDFGPNEVLAAGLGASAVDSAVFAPDGLCKSGRPLFYGRGALHVQVVDTF